MKYFVYVILAEKYDKIYIGITGNLEMRLFAHNNLPKGWTKNFQPWKLVYSEEFSTKAEALFNSILPLIRPGLRNLFCNLVKVYKYQKIVSRTKTSIFL